MSRNIRKTIIESRIKEVHSLEMELREIRIAENNLGYIILNKPLRDGWFRTFRLRDDIKKHKQAKVYQEILDAITIEIWGREKKYADKSWHNYFKKSYCHVQRPGIRYLNSKEYCLLSVKAQKYFRPLSIKRLHKYETIYFCTLPKYYFRDVYRRSYIYSRKIISSYLERRSQEIMEILAKPELYRYSIFYNYSARYYFKPHKGQRRKAKMLIDRMNLYKVEELVYKYY